MIGCAGPPIAHEPDVVDVTLPAPADQVRTAVIQVLTDGGYEVEAAVPLSALGLKPTAGLRLKMDWGMLVSGPDGNEVIRRVYWANQATNITADAPSEARLHPNLWGHVLFHDRKKNAEDRLDAFDKPPMPKGLDDLLDGKK